MVKLVLSSIIFTAGADFVTLGIKKFSLCTPLDRWGYLRLKLDNLPEYVIELHNLRDNTTEDGYVYVEVCKGMYGLPQAGLLTHQLFEK